MMLPADAAAMRESGKMGIGTAASTSASGKAGHRVARSDATPVNAGSHGPPERPSR